MNKKEVIALIKSEKRKEDTKDAQKFFVAIGIAALVTAAAAGIVFVVVVVSDIFS